MNTTPTLEMLAPATLTVDINVRKDAALTAEFIASIKEHGVMEPVIAHRKDGVKLLGRVGRVVFVEGPKADAAVEDSILRVSLAAAAGPAGRPSSERIVRTVAGF